MRRSVLAVVVACGGSPATARGPQTPPSPPPAVTGIRDKADAIARFKAAWQARVRPLVPDRTSSVIAALDHRMGAPDVEREYWTEGPAPCRERADRVASLDHPPGQELVVIGTLAELARHDRCWSVIFTDPAGDAEGFLDDASGTLILVWQIPEG
jgi:hypothetical protein